MEVQSFNGWQIAAGVGLFLFGMHVMENSIRHLADRSFKVFLRKQTSHPARALMAGLVITALLQSSSIVNLLTLAFVAAGVVSMRNALAVILGSNVGSTVYNWIVVYAGFKFDIQAFAFPLMAFGSLGLIFFQHQKKIMHWTRLVIGFSLLFFGLANIKQGVEVLVTDLNFVPFQQYGNWLFVLTGFAITTIVQSSSTTVVICLAALNAGALNLETAAALVIGSELGTSMKVVMGAAGTVPDKKRVALGNFIFNLGGSILAFAFLGPLLMLITEVIGFKDHLISLVFFQTAINLISVAVFYPFLKPLAVYLERKFGNDDISLSVHLKELLLHDPEEGFKAATRETHRLLLNAVELNMEALEIGHRPTGRLVREQDLISRPRSQTYSDHYETVKHLNGEIIDFCLDLKSREQDLVQFPLDSLLGILKNTMNATKSIKDIRHNIKTYRESENDLLHDFFIKIRENEAPFYTTVAETLYSTRDETSEKALMKLIQESKMRYDLYLAEIFKLSEQEKLHDLELATLMNVFTSINASHESLSQAIMDFLALGEK